MKNFNKKLQNTINEYKSNGYTVWTMEYNLVCAVIPGDESSMIGFSWENGEVKIHG